MILCWSRVCSSAKTAPFGRRLIERPVRLAILARPRSFSRGVVRIASDDFNIVPPEPRLTAAIGLVWADFSAKSAAFHIGLDDNHALDSRRTIRSGQSDMNAQAPPQKATLARFVTAVRNFANSEVGWKAKWIFAALVALLFGANGLNVLNSYVGRNFMTAIANRDKAEFIHQAIVYVGVFAGSIVVAVVARFAEERLGLLWRESLTQRAIKLYLADGTYYRLDASGELANPDQRIAEDIRGFTVTTLSFVLMLLNGTFTIIAFSGVLWAISPLLFI